MYHFVLQKRRIFNIHFVLFNFFWVRNPTPNFILDISHDQVLHPCAFKADRHGVREYLIECNTIVPRENAYKVNAGHLEHVIWVSELMKFSTLVLELTLSNRCIISYFRNEGFSIYIVYLFIYFFLRVPNLN